ncbi:MAG: c-type cytochrome, partial [Pirellulales bacterium]|nr:c-type cytochrome [Pirellulales bacterium]
SVFVDELRYPTSVAAWGRGVLICAAPDILYAEDTDGDDVADRREVLFTGFSTGNPQHQMNGLQRGLDGWFYCANGHSEGEVRSTKTGQTVEVSGRDFRIDPATGSIETEIGSTQFIRSRDDWGNWFGNNNIDPLWHYVLEERYLRRNPHVPYPDARNPVPDEPGSAPVYARSRTLERFNDLHTADHFTSACSTILYRDELLGAAWASSSFVSEPVHNLVHREVVRDDGLSLASRRAADEATSEFLASTDSFFRPTMVNTGPDGALWVADMYRLVIEHPEWIPAEAQARYDLRSGSDRGRIYRLYPVGSRPRPIVRLSELSPVELVTALDSPNGPQRDLAAQLLVERADEAMREPLRKLATGAKRPQVRVQALYVLDRLGALDAGVLATALVDDHPEVRRNALRLAEPQLARLSPTGGSVDALGAAVLGRCDDANPKVRLQLACTLGAWPHAEAGRALARLAMRDQDHPWLLAAVASSAPLVIDSLVEALAYEAEKSPPPPQLVTDLLATATALDRTDVLGRLLAVIVRRSDAGYETWQLEALAGLLEALDRRKLAVDQFVASHAQSLPGLARDLPQALDDARATAAAESAPLEQRLAAIRLLSHALEGPSNAVGVLTSLLGAQQPAQLQAAAVEALTESRGGEVPRALFAAWRSYSPPVRSAILDAMLRRAQWVDACLDALEQGTLAVTELDAFRRQRLLENTRAAVRERAGKLLAAQSQPRRAIVEQYRPALELVGNADAGREVFRNRCAVCHKFEGYGQLVGPDLSALVDKSSEALLTAILDPNRAVESRFVNYTAVTADGLTLTGLLAAETDGSITLLAQEGKEHVVLRTQLEALESAGKSLMPEGLEKDIAPQAMADLLAYLRAVVPAPKQFEGNAPALVEVDALRGELFCLANNAEIYGQTLVFEPSGNLGYWSSSDDRAIWTLNVQRAARYAVMLEWACDNGVAGNEFLIEVEGQRLAGKVEGTGSWSDYTRQTVGELRLTPGQHRLGMRASGTIQGALFDLKSITLRPVGK